jgi:type I restriction enzyme, S subunit
VNTGWPRVRLGDVLRFTPRLVAVDSTRTYREIGIRSHGRGVFHKPPVTGLDIGNKKVFYIEPGDFVLSIVFAWEGAVAVTSEAEAGMIASHRFPTFRPDPARLDVKYVQYWCQTELGRSLLDRVSPGGAGRNRTLNRNAFLNQDVPLPPVAEQQRVVARIEDLTVQINTARALSEQTSAGTDSLLVGMAHGSNPDRAATLRAGVRCG